MIRIVIVSVSVLAVVFVSGCASRGPKAVPQDRFDYASAISSSLKEQTLLNIVKFRYYDWPVFLDVEQIVSAYTWESTGSAGAVVRNPFDTSFGDLGFSGTYSERPTIVYKPLKGRSFVKNIMTPISPPILFSLIHSGWPADLIFRIGVNSVNGEPNSSPTTSLDQAKALNFHKMAQLFRKLQLGNALIMDLKEVEGKATAVIGFREALMDEQTRAEVASLKSKLGLDSGKNRYDVKWDVFSRDPSILAIQTRSAIQIISVMSKDVDVPGEDLSEGQTLDYHGEGKSPGTISTPLINIKSGTSAPDNAFVKVTYNDHWFWVEKNDIESKKMLLMLIFLLRVASPGEGTGAPLVITTG